MNKKLLKAFSLMSLVLIFSVNIVSAHTMEENVSNSKDVIITPLATVFEIHGGHGEWGHGFFNMWGKYWHMTKSHRVVLIKDNSHIYGAWEDGGPTESYRETSNGSNMNATGEVR